MDDSLVKMQEMCDDLEHQCAAAQTSQGRPTRGLLQSAPGVSGRTSFTQHSPAQFVQVKTTSTQVIERQPEQRIRHRVEEVQPKQTKQ